MFGAERRGMAANCVAELTSRLWVWVSRSHRVRARRAVCIHRKHATTTSRRRALTRKLTRGALRPTRRCVIRRLQSCMAIPTPATRGASARARCRASGRTTARRLPWAFWRLTCEIRLRRCPRPRRCVHLVNAQRSRSQAVQPSKTLH